MTETKRPVISIVVSRGQSHNPKKRQLEDELIEALRSEPLVQAVVLPHLYDLKPGSEALQALDAIEGDMILCSWLYRRAAFWILDRNNIRGKFGETELTDVDEDDQEQQDELAAEEEKQRVVDTRPQPDRTIYCLDLRTEELKAPYIEEFKRIITESVTRGSLMQWVQGSPQPEQLQRYLGSASSAESANSSDGDPGSRDSHNGHPPSGHSHNGDSHNGHPLQDPSNGPIQIDQDDFSVPLEPIVVSQSEGRRWYPVIDFGRCTNCMECIDFCLFGVYGVDQAETILVEQPDNCRKGCPACSRVCPENAIIFPQHKTPTIAGSEEVAGGLKIDLSQLFGAPEPGAPGAADAIDVAARERDEQLLLAGREAVGMSVGIARRQENKPDKPKDELDDLIDDLDNIDL